ncbi:MAG: hypothetical protein MI922_17285, partial [Bacteroidales bacterium]|nr:hypothetical protein [Bacteroidales bacterium]
FGFNGICHCQGSISYKSTICKYNAKHNRDFLTFSKDNKTITIMPEELKKIGMPMVGKEHRHSELDNSKLGPKQIAIPKAVEKKLIALINKKFKALK